MIQIPTPKLPGAGMSREERKAAFDKTKARWKEWSRIHFRRWAHVFHGAVAGKRAVGPISFLGISAALGLILTLTTLYSIGYAVTLNGSAVGIVSSQEMVDQAMTQVEQEGSRLLGYEYQIPGTPDYHLTLALKTDLTDEAALETYFFEQLNEVSDQLRKYEVSLDGQAVGVIKDQTALNSLLTDLKARYTNENTVSCDFMQKVSVRSVYVVDDLMTAEEMEQVLTTGAGGSGAGTYTVVQGDTFNAIAYANDMSVSDLKALNPDVDINRLMVGDVLNVKGVSAALSVQTVDHVTYTQAIECPVETVNDSSMYKGTSKIISQGVEGEAQVEANITRINGVEQSRDILSSVTTREPTKTVKAVGTKEKPKTASTGSFSWPISGRITSYFGGRYIFGGYSYHSGIDIATSYGATVRAADGGTVTFAGTKGSYGKLVIITHDNGTQTYYGHNSSLLVSAGSKVAKGQAIAKAGSTGRSTGVHCHFEVRVRGNAVNPLNYLR